MKTRVSFVTNSSSCSYVCDICGNHEGGHDSCSMEDYGFAYCECGACICIEHFDEADSLENLISEDFRTMYTHMEEKGFILHDPNRRSTSFVPREHLEYLKSFMFDFIGDKYKSYYTPEKWFQTHGYDKFEEDWFAAKESFNEYFNEEESYSRCPICSLKEVSDTDMVKYILIELNKTPEEVKEEIKNSFGNFEKFKEYINK